MNTVPGSGKRLRMAANVTLTRLPLGGVVLVDGVTMNLAECREPQAAVLDRVLTAGARVSDLAEPEQALVRDLVEGEWLVQEDEL